MGDKCVRIDYGNHMAEHMMLCVDGNKITAEEYIALCEKDSSRECDGYNTIKAWS